MSTGFLIYLDGLTKGSRIGSRLALLFIQHSDLSQRLCHNDSSIKHCHIISN